jgi:hypothetical protein
VYFFTINHRFHHSRETESASTKRDRLRESNPLLGEVFAPNQQDQFGHLPFNLTQVDRPSVHEPVDLALFKDKLHKRGTGDDFHRHCQLQEDHHPN